MATWHIKVKTDEIAQSETYRALDKILVTTNSSHITQLLAWSRLKDIEKKLINEGFDVTPLPQHMIGWSITHPKSAAMAIFLLKSNMEGFSLERLT